LALLDWFKGKLNTNKELEQAKLLSGQPAAFSSASPFQAQALIQTGEDLNNLNIFKASGFSASDVVQAAIQCIVDEMSKISPRHIRRSDDLLSASSVGRTGIQKTLNYPNPIMTAADFYSRVMWRLYLDSNAFIVPVWGSGGKEAFALEALVPVQPQTTELINDASNTLYIRFKFANGSEVTYPYADIIHLRLKYGQNEFMGGDAWGRPDTKALEITLGINEMLLKGVAQAMGGAGQILGILQYATMVNREALYADIAEFNAKLLEPGNNGIVPLDAKSTYTPIDRKIQFVDPATVKFIDEKILRYFGVPLPILLGDYTPQQYEAFYQKTLEPRIIALSQALTRALFTPNQLAHGNEIVIYPTALAFMTMSEKIQLIDILGQSGTITENEKREMLGMQPLPELEGVRMVSLNYINSNVAATYQLGEEPPADPIGDPNA